VLPPFGISEMYPWIRDAAAAAAAAAVGFAGSHHHHHYNHHHHNQGQHPGISMNGGIKGENGYPHPPSNSVNDCMLALDYAHNKVRCVILKISRIAKLLLLLLKHIYSDKLALKCCASD